MTSSRSRIAREWCLRRFWSGYAYKRHALDISEYDDRCRHIANARVHGELSQVFLDLPRIPRDNQEQPSQALAVPGYGRQIYTAEEVAAAAGRGRNIRGG